MTPSIKYEYSEHLIERQFKSEQAMLTEFSKGDYTLKNPLIKYNPYFVNELSAVIMFKTPTSTAVTIRIKGKTKAADIVQTFPPATKHVLPVIGLYSDYENKIELMPYQTPSQKVVHSIKTPAVKGVNLVEKMETRSDYLQDDVVFLCPAVSDLAIAVDYAGDVRLSFAEALVWEAKRQENGNILMGSERLIRMPYFVTGLYEMSLVGKIYREIRIPYGYHHDQINLPDGDYLVLNSNFHEGTVEDHAVIIDHQTGRVKRTINFAEIIKPGAQKSGSWSDEDWFHCNAVWYDCHTHSLTLSGRHINALVNIDFDSEAINWILSDPENWVEEYQPYLLKAVNQEEFDWHYEPHACIITPHGDVMLFDNHHWGSQDPAKYKKAEESYSRGVLYRIDPQAMTVEQRWQYGKERGSDFYSPYISNVRYYNENHYMIHSGGITFNEDGSPSDKLGSVAQLEDPNIQLKSITVEMQHQEKKLELTVNSHYYRANKFPLYAKNGNNLQLGRGYILGNLGETPMMNYPIPATVTGQLLPDFHQARLVEEADLITFFAKFERGDLVVLVLESETEKRQYFISTSKGKRGAMCTGTFLLDDDRNTRTIISKEGLKGSYDVSVLVEDQLFKTGIVIEV